MRVQLTRFDDGARALVVLERLSAFLEPEEYQLEVNTPLRYAVELYGDRVDALNEFHRTVKELMMQDYLPERTSGVVRIVPVSPGE